MTAHDGATESLPTIAFIGLGSMGLPMAVNLLKAGYIVRGHSRNEKRTADFVAAGGVDQPELSKLIDGAEVIITMVPDGDVVLELLEQPGGMAEKASPGSLLIDMSTIAPDQARAVGAECHELGLEFLDAPVSGGTVGASNGTLSIMVGGTVGSVERAMPIFMVLGNTVTHLGPVGAGQVTKAANQLIVGATLAALSEAIVLLESHGVDPSLAFGALSGGLAGSRIIELKSASTIARDFSPTFTLALHSKDMGIVRSAAQSTHSRLPVADVVAELMHNGLAHGWGELDHSALLKVIALASTSTSDEKEELS